MSETTETQPKQGKADGYPCPQCGAQTSLKPGTDSLGCDHCGAVVPIDAGGKVIREHDFQAALAGTTTKPANQMSQGAREFQCKVCGARAIVTRQAERCAFCDAPMVVEMTTSEQTILPESLLPFVIDQKTATGKFQDWLKSRWFAPSDLTRRAKKDGMDGVYLPYWCYDSNTTTRYSGERGEYYYVSETYRDDKGETQTRQVRHTRWYPTSGTVQVNFDDVLVCGSQTLPRALLEKLEPWDLPELRAFDAGYLSGFVAERYKIGLEAGFVTAEARMVPKIRSAIESDIGGDDQRIGSMNVRHADVRFKHLLLPLWISSFRYKEKTYRFTVNARSGQVSGERPWSVAKIVLTVLAVIAVIAAIVVLAQGSK